MRASLTSLGLALIGLGLSGAVGAAPVQIGSSYSFRINPEITPDSVIANVTFDGIAESFTLSDHGGPSGVTVRLTESQSDLGGGLHSVLVDLSTDAEMFQSAGEFGFYQIGTGGNPLDLLGDYRLVAAVMRLYSDDVQIAAADFVAGFPTAWSSLNPWDGYFLANNRSGGFTGSGQAGIDRMTLEFRLQQVPLPGSLPLAGLALAGLLATRRRTGG